MGSPNLRAYSECRRMSQEQMTILPFEPTDAAAPTGRERK
jgi:hypothetical protein